MKVAMLEVLLVALLADTMVYRMAASWALHLAVLMDAGLVDL